MGSLKQTRSDREEDLPAFAGIVQGVVVHIARHKSGKNSSNKPSLLEGVLTNLKRAYMLLEM